MVFSSSGSNDNSFLAFFIIRKFFLSLSTILSANYVTCGTLLLAGAIRIRSVLFTAFIRVGDVLLVARGKLREELLDFRDERHFFWYSTPENQISMVFSSPGSNDNPFLEFLKKVLRNPFLFFKIFLRFTRKSR